MASVSMEAIGSLRRTEAIHRSSPSSHTHLELAPGAFLVASVITQRNQCVVELLTDTPDTDSTTVPSSAASTSRLSTQDETSLTAIKSNFRLAKVFQVLDDEGSITAIELVRDYRKVDNTASRRRLLGALHVHLFIGTSNGTVIVCNALRGTIMVLAQFQYHGVAATGASAGKENESVVRFAPHFSLPTVRFNPNLSRPVVASPSESLCAVYVVHSGGRTAVFSRAALDTFVEAAVQRLDGRRPHFVLEWSPESTTSSFPAAGPAVEFASHVEDVAILHPAKRYTAVELQTLKGIYSVSEWTGGLPPRGIRDAAFFVRAAADTTAVLRDGPQATEALLLAGDFPALSAYVLEQTRPSFSAARTVRAVVSLIGGVARNLWGRTPDVVAAAPPRLTKRPQLPRDAFFEGDTAFHAVRVDPSAQWAACYSEAAGRIYLYDLTTNAVWRVMKGCRAADFQWHVATIGGKRTLLLIVHLMLRHAVEVYALRLGRRIAARHIPPGSVLLRPDAAAASGVLFLSPSGDVFQLRIDLDAEENTNRNDNYSSKTTNRFDVGASSNNNSTVTNKDSDRRSGMGESGVTVTARPVEMPLDALRLPCDVLRAVLNVSLPSGPATDSEAFAVYKARMVALATAVKSRFSPGVDDDRCLSLAPIDADTIIPQSVTAAQCLNYTELRLACVECYRRAILQRVEGEASPSTAESNASGSVMFDSRGLPNPAVEAAVRAVQSAANVLPALQRLFTLARSSLTSISLSKSDSTLQPATPMNLENFLFFFDCGGYKLEYRRDNVRRRELDEDVDLSGPLGAVFLARNCGMLQQQLDTLGTLGLRAADVAVITLSWLCRAFAASPQPSILSELGDLTFLFQTCGDAAFTTAVEAVRVPIFARSEAEQTVAEATVLLLLLCILLRQQERPPAPSVQGFYAQLLQQLLALHTLLRDGASLLAQGAPEKARGLRVGTVLRPPCGDDRTLAQHTDGKEQWVRKGKLEVDTKAKKTGEQNETDDINKNDAITVLLFTHCAPVVAPKLCALLPGFSPLRVALGGVDPSVLFAILFAPGTSSGAPWLQDGAWAASEFARTVLRPLNTLALPLLGSPDRKNEEGSGNSSILRRVEATTSGPETAGLAALLAVALVVLERETSPLREVPLSFLQCGTAPDANMFDAIASTWSGKENRTAEEERRDLPRGSRATRDFFSSCRDLFTLTQSMASRLSPNTAEDDSHASIHAAVMTLLAADDMAALPLLPSVLRSPLVEIGHTAKTLPRRLSSARFFLDTVALLAFGETPAVGPVPWSAMFDPPSTLFQFLSRTPGGGSGNAGDWQDTIGWNREEQLTARSAFMRHLIAPNDENIEGRDEFGGRLCLALGLSGVVRDLPQLALLDAAARRAASTDALSRAFNSVTSRHLAARVAATGFRLLVSAAITQVTAAKRAVPRDNRAEIQRAALRLQRVMGCMSETCVQWVRHGSTKSLNSEKTKAIVTGKGVSASRVESSEPIKETLLFNEDELERRLVAADGWGSAGNAALVEERVATLLRMSRSSAERTEFGSTLATLARVAAEGCEEMSEEMGSIAEELPVAATRLAAVL